MFVRESEIERFISLSQKVTLFFSSEKNHFYFYYSPFDLINIVCFIIFQRNKLRSNEIGDWGIFEEEMNQIELVYGAL